MKNTRISLNKLQLNDRIRVTDPGNCNGEYAGTLNVKKGLYSVFALLQQSKDTAHNRIVQLSIRHSEHRDAFPDNPETFIVGVDSGQAGFFDEEYFRKNCESENWYSRICRMTESDNRCGCLNNLCAVSESGYGDGGYTCYTARDNDGMVVAADLVFA